MIKNNKKKNIIIGSITTLVILLAWWLATKFKLAPEILLPSPTDVVQSFFNLISFGYNGVSLGQHYLITLGRVFIAVFFAIIIGIPAGLISGYFENISAVVDPIIQFIRPIPPLAYYTLLILWFGIGEVSKVSLLFLAALPPIYLASYDAVHRINHEYLQSASSLGANNKQLFFKIVLPVATPGIFTGVRLATGVAYTTIVSAEMIASSTGLGWMVIDASHYLKSDVMFVGIILLGVTGMLIDYLLKLLEHRFVHWSGK